MRRTVRGMVLLSASAALVAIASAAPAYADDDPVTSSVQLSATTLAPGATFTVTEQILNPEAFTVTSGRAALYAKEASLSGLVDLVSCTGSNVPCYQYLSSYRGPVGDLIAGAGGTVTFTFQVKSFVIPGRYTIQDQLVGDNYAFDTNDGPVLTIL